MYVIINIITYLFNINNKLNYYYMIITYYFITHDTIGNNRKYKYMKSNFYM